MAKTDEQKLNSVNKAGRVWFAVADALGTLGKCAIQIGAVALLAGFGCAGMASWKQHRANKIKQRIINNRRK